MPGESSFSSSRANRCEFRYQLGSRRFATSHFRRSELSSPWIRKLILDGVVSAPVPERNDCSGGMTG